ncbi:MAG: pilus assembly protein PilM [Candidatus Hydrogenedentes bacterium]|nr:pilus assembly protein PilM [Candidatus Hydrogenedentota bacterium]
MKAVLMSRASGRLRIDQVTCAPVDRNELNADPVRAQVSAVRNALDAMPVLQSQVVAALTGNTVVVRYPRFTDVPKDQFQDAIDREAKNNMPYDLRDIFLDWVVLDEYQEDDRQQKKVLLLAAKHEEIEKRLQILQLAEVQCGVLGVDSLALADAGEACGFLPVGETVAIINVGLNSSSIHFIKDGISNFIREVNWGGREIIQAVAKGRRCDYEDAIKLVEEFQLSDGAEDDMPEAIEALETEISLADDDSVPMAGDPFADLGGGGSLLDPLEEELGDMGGGASQSYNQGMGAAPAAFDKKVESVEELVAAPLGRMGVEFRRSFDYYEHQLYEQPVDRIVLAGGLADFPLVAVTLKDELGFGVVEIANPLDSSLLLGGEDSLQPLIKRPAQFVVAVGLAARGMVDL